MRLYTMLTGGPTGITDQVAKESSDSTASTHPAHQVDTGAISGGSLGANAHKANPVRIFNLLRHYRSDVNIPIQGPVIAEDIGKPASKEELKKRAEELNK
jgi:hypothetical protein